MIQQFVLGCITTTTILVVGGGVVVRRGNVGSSMASCSSS